MSSRAPGACWQTMENTMGLEDMWSEMPCRSRRRDGL